MAVVPFLALCLAAGLAAHPGSDVPLAADLVFTVALIGPLALRRRYPVMVFAVVAGAALLHIASGFGLLLADAAVLAAMATVAVHRRTASALAALAAVEAGLALLIVRSPYADWGMWRVFAVYGTLVLLCWVTALYTKVRREYFAGLEDRARWLEREREARAKAAVAEERARISREMHDIVAHSLSVMVAQADGATYVVDSDPARARQALVTVADTGRTALSEMHGILGVLRDGGEDTDGAGPQPDLRRLDGLVARVREAGLPAELTVEGEGHGLSAGVELAAYRVVQEALTNTLKHAGPDVSRVRIRVRHRPDALELEITDDGRGGSAAGDVEHGHGLIGMRERVSVHGGTVRAGPRPGGGYRVAAVLPLDRNTDGPGLD